LLVGLAIGGLVLLGAIGAAVALAVTSGAGGAAGALAGGIGLGVIVAVVGAAGLFLLARWCLAVPAIVLDGEGPISGSSRSSGLVGGATARFAALVVVAGVAAFAPVGIAFLPALLARGEAAVEAVIGILGALTWPVLPIAFTVAYARLERSAVPPPRTRPRLAPVLAVAVGGVVALSLVVGVVGGSALAGDLSYVTMNRGKVMAGSGLAIDSCRVTGARDVFETGEDVAVIAILARTIPSGSEVSATVTRDGQWLGTAADSFAAAADCIGESFSAAEIALAGGPGRYRLEYRVGDELLASGGFEIVAPGGSSAVPSASPPTPAAPTAAATPAPTRRPSATPAGTIRYGTAPGPDACSVGGGTDRFTIGQQVYVAVELGRVVQAGTEVRIAVRYGDAEIAADTTTAEEATACLDGSLSTTGLPAGRYAIEYGLGGEILARGDFELVP
jgi:hypothetical protein